ncbi:unnamed protein product [Prorocentrum cordatum]|uniref:Kinesin light chain n=1 Tax=Prorocentrum cordatum TaxID=2364126 RepID=A0ABN9U8B0_9DINO|nr:unnamed protein product [Polarella glacialis]
MGSGGRGRALPRAGVPSFRRRTRDGSAEALGAEHPDSLRCASNLAALCQAMGKYAEAVQVVSDFSGVGAAAAGGSRTLQGGAAVHARAARAKGGTRRRPPRGPPDDGRPGRRHAGAGQAEGGGGAAARRGGPAAEGAARRRGRGGRGSCWRLASQALQILGRGVGHLARPR